LGIQDEFLSDTLGIYFHTIRTKELTGEEVWRQLDLFVKQRTDAERAKSDSRAYGKMAEEVNADTDSAKTYWKYVWVIGQHQKSNHNWEEKFLQLGKYVRDIFSAQPTRRFGHAFTLVGPIMEFKVMGI